MEARHGDREEQRRQNNKAHAEPYFKESDLQIMGFPYRFFSISFCGCTYFSERVIAKAITMKLRTVYNPERNLVNHLVINLLLSL